MSKINPNIKKFIGAIAISNTRNSHNRQLEVIDEAVTNFNNIKYKFQKASDEAQRKLLNDYLFYSELSIDRIQRLEDDPTKKGKNKLYLYDDIELTVYYYYSLKHLTPLSNIKMDYLGFEELIIEFTGLLRRFDLTHYERAIRFLE